jgi:hypothetical protein
MKQEEVAARIETELTKRKIKVVNKNAVSALFGAFSDPLGSLGKIFLGREDALDGEKQRISQEVVLELLCKIDAAISNAAAQSASTGVTIGGLIETTSFGSDHVVGAKVGSKSGSVEFQPGTQIKTTAHGAKTVTGLHIE